jgi:hypothetical protein
MCIETYIFSKIYSNFVRGMYYTRWSAVFCLIFHYFTLDKTVFHNRTLRLYYFWFIFLLIWLKLKPRIFSPLELQSAFSSGTEVGPTYKRDLRHTPQDCNYMAVSKVRTSILRTSHICWPLFSSSHNTTTQVTGQKVMDS